jgi:hypothetical protein
MADIIPDIQPSTGGGSGDASTWSQSPATSDVNVNSFALQNVGSMNTSGNVTASSMNTSALVASTATALALNSNVIDSPVGYLTVSKPLLLPSAVSFQPSGGVSWGLMQPNSAEPGIKVGKQSGLNTVQYGYLYDSSINPPPTTPLPTNLVRNPMLSDLGGGGYDITGVRAVKTSLMTPSSYLSSFLRIQIPDATGQPNWVNVSSAVGGATIALNTVNNGCKLTDCAALMLHMSYSSSTSPSLGFATIAASFGFSVDSSSYADARIVGTTFVPNGFSNSSSAVYLMRRGIEYQATSSTMTFWINFLNGSSFTNAGMSIVVTPAL